MQNSGVISSVSEKELLELLIHNHIELEDMMVRSESILVDIPRYEGDGVTLSSVSAVPVDPKSSEMIDISREVLNANHIPVRKIKVACTKILDIQHGIWYKIDEENNTSNSNVNLSLQEPIMSTTNTAAPAAAAKSPSTVTAFVIRWMPAAKTFVTLLGAAAVGAAVKTAYDKRKQEKEAPLLLNNVEGSHGN